MSHINKQYRIPFWRGFLHAVVIALYVLFISLIWISISPILGAEFNPVVNIVAGLFVLMLTFGICVYFLFFEPFKLIVHHHFKAASMMVFSTFGWLFVFFILFIIAFSRAIYS